MNRRETRWAIGAALVILAGAVSARLVFEAGARRITVDYPLEGSVFPPEFPAPTFLWRDAATNATAWKVDVTLAGGASLHEISQGEPMRVGEIDPRCVGGDE